MRRTTFNSPLFDLYRFLAGVDTVAKMVKALYLTSVVLQLTGINESRRCALHPPPLPPSQLVKNKAVNAPVKFENILMVMINLETTCQSEFLN